MADTIQARRYAQAMFELAQEQQQADAWQADLQSMALAAGDKAVLDVLENPAVSRQQKDDMLARATRDVSPMVMNLIGLLVSRGTIRLLSEISNEFDRLLDESRGIASGSVITAVPIDEKEQKKLNVEIGGLMKKTVELEPAVDPDILGGMVVRVGGKLLDGSTRSKLAALKRQLASGEKRR